MPLKISIFANETKRFCRESENFVRGAAEKYRVEVVPEENADVVVALGGDGTILRAVHKFQGRPVLGLNIGGLGFLASVEKKDFDRAMELLAASRFSVSERTMLAIRSREATETIVALNDIVFKGALGHPSVMDVSVDNHAFTRYFADGMIVATPTGSTAYSLSAGGPVLAPDSSSFVVTPINPHALGVRPLVIKDSCSISVVNRSRNDAESQAVVIFADSVEAVAVGVDEEVVVEKSRHIARLVTLDGYDPYEVLSRKLGWRGANFDMEGEN
jgi:NAD+ kinase